MNKRSFVALLSLGALVSTYPYAVMTGLNYVNPKGLLSPFQQILFDFSYSSSFLVAWWPSRLRLLFGLGADAWAIWTNPLGAGFMWVDWAWTTFCWLCLFGLVGWLSSWLWSVIRRRLGRVKP